MGVNSLQVSWHRQPSSLRLGGLGQTVESLVHETSLKSYFFPSPSLSTSLTFNQMDYKQKWSTLNILLIKTSLSYIRQTLKTAYSQTASCLGAPYASHVSTNLESTTTEGASAAGGLPEEANAIGDSRKTTETESRTSLVTVYTCTVPGCQFPAKFGFQPIKLELYPLAHTYTAKYVRVQLRHLGVYKES